SPDGKWVIYLSVSPAESLYSLWKVSIEGGSSVKLTDGDCGQPAVSPDGRQIAFFQGDGYSTNPYRIVVIPFGGGPPEQTFLVPRDLAPLALRWTANGRGLSYSAQREGISNVWVQSVGGGPPKQLTDFKVEGRF